MSKKILMHIMFVVAVLLFFTGAFFEFSYDNQKIIYSEKAKILLDKPDLMSNEEFIDIIMEVSGQLSADIMYERLNNDLEYEFYKTNIKEEYLKLSTSQKSCIIKKDEMLSTKKGNGAYRIYGFPIPGENIHIFSLEKIKEFDLSSGIYLVEAKRFEDFVYALNERGIMCARGGEIVDWGDGEDFFVVGLLFSVFSIITIVFYVFSRGKEFIVKKSFGYGTREICISELKSNLYVFFIEIICVIILSIVVFSIIYDMPSVLLFLKELLPVMYCVFVLTGVVLSVAILGVASGIRVRSMKGYNNNKELYVVAVLLKLVSFVICCMFLSEIVPAVYETYQMYSATKSATKEVEGYAATTTSGAGEAPEDNILEYGERISRFFEIMNEQHGLMVLEALQADEPVAQVNPYRLNRITVNDNYIDASECIYLTDGSRLTSEVLKEGRRNFLVPEGYDTTVLVERIAEFEEIEPEEINCVEYSSNSRFFSYSNEIATKQGGWFGNVIVDVFDLEYEKEYHSPEVWGMKLLAYLSKGFIFEYDTESSLSPYEQIKTYLKECQLENLVLSTPKLSDIFDENLKYCYNDILFFSILLTIVMFVYLVMLFGVSELFYLIHAKDISVKQMNGYSSLRIFRNILILKVCALMLAVAIGSFLVPMSFGIALVMVLTEIIVFSFILKKQVRHNLVSVIKGE